MEELRSEARLAAVLRDDYGLDAAHLERLYSKAKRHQWNAEADVDWGLFESGVPIIDPERDLLSRLPSIRALPKEAQDALFREAALFLLSQILHGEQAALMVCGQLVNLVPDVDGKLAAAVQVMDEARHVEVFARYLALHGHRYPMDPDLGAIVSALLAETDWEAKCVGMQVILESVALSFFRLGEACAVEPLFASLIGRVHEDESRHVAYGVLALEERLPGLSEATRRRLEDFALDAVTRIAGRAGRPTFTTQLRILERVPVDAGELLPRVVQDLGRLEDLDLEGLRDPVADTVLPNLLRCGLVPERHLLPYLAQGFDIDLAAGTVRDLHSFHPRAREARARLAEAGAPGPS